MAIERPGVGRVPANPLRVALGSELLLEVVSKGSSWPRCFPLCTRGPAARSGAARRCRRPAWCKMRRTRGHGINRYEFFPKRRKQ
jgi:hypothetical protein